MPLDFCFFAPLLAAIAVRDAFLQRRDMHLILRDDSVNSSDHSVSCILACHRELVVAGRAFLACCTILANLGLGVASIVALCRYLSLDDTLQPTTHGEVLLFPALAVLAIALFYATNEMIGRFTDIATVVAAGLFFGLVFVCLWKRRVITCAILLLVPLNSPMVL